MRPDERLSNYLWPSVSYAHALEVGNYRAALRAAIAGYRHDGAFGWSERIVGAFARRNRGRNR